MALPTWLALGGDFRGGFVDQDVQDPSGNQVAVFPMQADLAAPVALPAGLSFYGIIGLRDQIRDADLFVPDQNFHPTSTSRLISRSIAPCGNRKRWGRTCGEHFYARYGLRFAEHILYVNRDLGFDELQETYNVSGG